MVNKTVEALDTTFSVEISGLCPFLKYTFKIAAKNSQGLGPYATLEG